ncbi:hypothetical protein BDV93DRAFT_514467 [Ceratobasidium sp. AG-I]|nr:hypothetical protein BDV93DRAFT_514467 [Ceratobasidium sp. AG-I]
MHEGIWKGASTRAGWQVTCTGIRGAISETNLWSLDGVKGQRFSTPEQSSGIPVSPRPRFLPPPLATGLRTSSPPAPLLDGNTTPVAPAATVTERVDTIPVAVRANLAIRAHAHALDLALIPILNSRTLPAWHVFADMPFKPQKPEKRTRYNKCLADRTTSMRHPFAILPTTPTFCYPSAAECSRLNYDEGYLFIPRVTLLSHGSNEALILRLPLYVATNPLALVNSPTDDSNDPTNHHAHPFPPCSPRPLPFPLRSTAPLLLRSCSHIHSHWHSHSPPLTLVAAASFSAQANPTAHFNGSSTSTHRFPGFTVVGGRVFYLKDNRRITEKIANPNLDARLNDADNRPILTHTCALAAHRAPLLEPYVSHCHPAVRLGACSSPSAPFVTAYELLNSGVTNTNEYTLLNIYNVLASSTPPLAYSKVPWQLKFKMSKSDQTTRNKPSHAVQPFVPLEIWDNPVVFTARVPTRRQASAAVALPFFHWHFECYCYPASTAFSPSTTASVITPAPALSPTPMLKSTAAQHPVATLDFTSALVLGPAPISITSAHTPVEDITATSDTLANNPTPPLLFSPIDEAETQEMATLFKQGHKFEYAHPLKLIVNPHDLMLEHLHSVSIVNPGQPDSPQPPFLQFKQHGSEYLSQRAESWLEMDLKTEQEIFELRTHMVEQGRLGIKERQQELQTELKNRVLKATFLVALYSTTLSPSKQQILSENEMSFPMVNPGFGTFMAQLGAKAVLNQPDFLNNGVPTREQLLVAQSHIRESNNDLVGYPESIRKVLRHIPTLQMLLHSTSMLHVAALSVEPLLDALTSPGGAIGLSQSWLALVTLEKSPDYQKGSTTASGSLNGRQVLQNTHHQKLRSYWLRGSKQYLGGAPDHPDFMVPALAQIYTAQVMGDYYYVWSREVQPILARLSGAGTPINWQSQKLVYANRRSLWLLANKLLMGDNRDRYMALSDNLRIFASLLLQPSVSPGNNPCSAITVFSPEATLPCNQIVKRQLSNIIPLQGAGAVYMQTSLMKPATLFSIMFYSAQELDLFVFEELPLADLRNEAIEKLNSPVLHRACLAMVKLTLNLLPCGSQNPMEYLGQLAKLCGVSRNKHDVSWIKANIPHSPVLDHGAMDQQYHNETQLLNAWVTNTGKFTSKLVSQVNAVKEAHLFSNAIRYEFWRNLELSHCQKDHTLTEYETVKLKRKHPDSGDQASSSNALRRRLPPVPQQPLSTLDAGPSKTASLHAYDGLSDSGYLPVAFKSPNMKDPTTEQPKRIALDDTALLACVFAVRFRLASNLVTKTVAHASGGVHAMCRNLASTIFGLKNYKTQLNQLKETYVMDLAAALLREGERHHLHGAINEACRIVWGDGLFTQQLVHWDRAPGLVQINLIPILPQVAQAGFEFDVHMKHLWVGLKLDLTMELEDLCTSVANAYPAATTPGGTSSSAGTTTSTPNDSKTASPAPVAEAHPVEVIDLTYDTDSPSPPRELPPAMPLQEAITLLKETHVASPPLNELPDSMVVQEAAMPLEEVHMYSPPLSDLPASMAVQDAAAPSEEINMPSSPLSEAPEVMTTQGNALGLAVVEISSTESSESDLAEMESRHEALNDLEMEL